MIKLLVGLKGTGKTKTLIEKSNEAIETTNGAVVCIEKGKKLIHQINYRIRLIETDEYSVDSARSLYGFVCGIFASNHDIKEIFIDSALKICRDDMDDFVKFMEAIDVFATNNSVDFLITASVAAEDVPASLNKYINE